MNKGRLAVDVDPRTIKEIQLYFCNTDKGADPFAQRYADEICKPVRPCITPPNYNEFNTGYEVYCELKKKPFMPRPGKCEQK